MSACGRVKVAVEADGEHRLSFLFLACALLVLCCYSTTGVYKVVYRPAWSGMPAVVARVEMGITWTFQTLADASLPASVPSPQGRKSRFLSPAF